MERSNADQLHVGGAPIEMRAMSLVTAAEPTLYVSTPVFAPVNVKRIVPTVVKSAAVSGVNGAALKAGPVVRKSSPRYEPSGCLRPSDIEYQAPLPSGP